MQQHDIKHMQNNQSKQQTQQRRGQNYYSQELIERIIKLRKQGLSTIDISYEVRISTPTICKILRQQGEEVNRAETHAKKKQKVLDEVYDLYINKDLNTKEIAKIIGRCQKTVQNRLKELKEIDPERGKEIDEKLRMTKIKRIENARRYIKRFKNNPKSQN